MSPDTYYLGRLDKRNIAFRQLANGKFEVWDRHALNYFRIEATMLEEAKAVTLALARLEK